MHNMNGNSCGGSTRALTTPPSGRPHVNKPMLRGSGYLYTTNIGHDASLLKLGPALDWDAGWLGDLEIIYFRCFAAGSGSPVAINRATSLDTNWMYGHVMLDGKVIVRECRPQESR